MSAYQHAFTVQFDEADPAGISFFANSLRYHHRAYEAWVTHAMSVSYRDWFQSSEFAVPIRKSESEYNGPLHPGSTYHVHLSLKEVGDSSFELESTITPIDQHTVVLALSRTVHVFMDLKTRKKMLIPDRFRSLFATSMKQ